MKERKGNKFKPIACPETSSQRAIIREALARMEEAYRTVVRKDVAGVVDHVTKRRASNHLLVDDAYLAGEVTWSREEEEKKRKEADMTTGRRGAVRHIYFDNTVSGTTDVYAADGVVSGSLGVDKEAWTCPDCQFDNRTDPEFCAVCEGQRPVDE